MLLPIRHLTQTIPDPLLIADGTQCYKMLFFQAREVPGIKIFHYCGGLNFATRNHFKNELYRYVGINPQEELVQKNQMEKSQTRSLAISQPEGASVRKEVN